MNIILGLAIYAFIIFLNLLPYYIAYLIIRPSSFLGVVGVFVLGSIIVPLTAWVSMFIRTAVVR